jgi:hypothetical protein
MANRQTITAPMDAKSTPAATAPGSSKMPGTGELVVFSILRDSACSECGEELGKGRLLRLEAARAFCLACADLEHLVFLPRGDPALTRRASRYSTLRAVVVRFSRSRHRYERQGVLVEEDALARAEQECLSDAPARALARERAAGQRQAADAEYVNAFARRVGELFPDCPVAEQHAIATHACQKYSGRVGRSAEARQLQANAVELAVRAHVRHVHTRYDGLLTKGLPRDEARALVAVAVTECVERWRSTS